MSVTTPKLQLENRAYVSEPITRCPPREKGRIRTLIMKMRETLEQEPYCTSIYVPSEVTSPEVRGHMTPEHIYLLDRVRVVEADYMIVIADHTSFGVGGEVEIATALGKPVVICSREEKLSRFLTGTPANAIRALDQLGYYLHYRDWRDLKPMLLPVVEGILNEPAAKVNLDVPFWDVGRQLKSIRKRKGLSIEEVAERTGLRTPHLRFLEKSLEDIRHELEVYQKEDMTFGDINLAPYQLEQLTNIGLPVLHRLAVALDEPVAQLMGDVAAPPVTKKGPSRESHDKLNRIREAREASLKARCSQFDVTFREYELLRENLVIKFMSDLELLNTKLSRRHQLIQEKEFHDALSETRRGY